MHGYVGSDVGPGVGASVGKDVGSGVGSAVGPGEGEELGTDVGPGVGSDVGTVQWHVGAYKRGFSYEPILLVSYKR